MQFHTTVFEQIPIHHGIRPSAMRRRLYGSIYRLANLFPIPTFHFSKTLCSSWPLRWRTIHPSLTARTRLPTKHQTPRSAHPTPSNRISLQPNLSMIKWNSFLSDPGLPWGRTMREKCPRCLTRCAIDLFFPHCCAKPMADRCWNPITQSLYARGEDAFGNSCGFVGSTVFSPARI